MAVKLGGIDSPLSEPGFAAHIAYIIPGSLHAHGSFRLVRCFGRLVHPPSLAHRQVRSSQRRRSARSGHDPALARFLLRASRELLARSRVVPFVRIRSRCRPSRPRAATRPGRACRRREHAGGAKRGCRRGRRVFHQLAVALRVPMARNPWLGKRRVRPGPQTRVAHTTGTDGPREAGACPGIAREGGNAGGRQRSRQFQGGKCGWERRHDFGKNLQRCSGTRLAERNATPKRSLSAPDRLASPASAAQRCRAATAWPRGSTPDRILVADTS